MSRERRPGPDLRRVAPTALAAALAVVYLIWQPPSLDLAAAEYRAWLFGEHGFAIWNGNWYGGHHLPGYSVLAPPLAHWLGPRLLGALAVVIAAWLFERLAHSRYGDRAWLGATWFAAGAATTLLSGRITFALGLVPALGALLALQSAPGDADRAGGARKPFPRVRERESASPSAGPARQPLPSTASTKPASRSVRLGAATLLAALTPLASPVAGLFLALAGVAYALGTRRAAGFAVAAAALAPIALLAVAFPEGGSHPFAASSFWPVIAFAVVALAVLPRRARVLRIAVVLYALGCAAAFALDTPVGGNSVRLGALCAGPLAALTLWPRRRLALALLAPFALWWQWNAAIDDVRTASGDRSVHAAYWAPLLAELERRGALADARGIRRAAGADGAYAGDTPGARSGAPDTTDADHPAPLGRLEIPFTRLHWEARHVAPRIPLARGWERQMDLKANPLFYGDQTGAPPLTADRYRRWLHDNAVRWVAAPRDLRLDYSARREARMIAHGLPYLREVWSDADWRLYEVRDAAPLVDPPARVTAWTVDSLTIDAARAAGRAVRLRVRWTPYWAVVAGDACVEPDGEWTRLRVRRAGEIRLATRFSPTRIGARSARCA